jgi:phosphoglycolate phosphatase-like HAD superfamily hydrolase
MAIANELMNPCFLQGLKCIIFDCDGVLIDSYESNMRYYSMIKKNLGLPPLTEVEKVYVHSRTHKDAIKFIAPGEYFKKAWAEVENFDSTSLLPYIKRSEGVLEFLWWLRSAGFLLAINTSRTGTIDMILEQKGLEGFFFPIITSAKVCEPKPHPEGVYKIMKRLQLELHEVAYIGDSIVDEKTALAAGVRFWAYRDLNLEADVHINDFWSIKAAMQRVYKAGDQVF